MHDMTIMMQCNLFKIKRNQNPDTHIRLKLFYYPTNYLFISMAKQGMSELHKIKWNRD
jgi:hypothetical protein